MHHGFSNLTLPARRPFKAIGVALIIKHGLVNLVLGREHKGAVLDDFLVERETSDEDYSGRGKLLVFGEYCF